MFTGSQVSAPVCSSRFTLVRRTPGLSSYLRNSSRIAVSALDWILRTALGIYEFSESPDCLLRIAIARAGRQVGMPDNLGLPRSNRLVDLHFWNEHFEALLRGKAPCTRARLICRHLEYSLGLLAAYLLAHPEIDAEMIHGRAVMPLGDRFAKFKGVAQAYGFRVTTSPVSGIGRFHDFWEDFLVRALLWAFNPGPARRRKLRLCRADVWIDHKTLMSRYLDNTDRAAAGARKAS